MRLAKYIVKHGSTVHSHTKTTATHTLTHSHTRTHTHTHTLTHVHRMDAAHSMMPAGRDMMGLWRCSFRLGLQWTCKPRWRIAHLSCAVFIVHATTQYSRQTCPAHSQWLMQFSTIVDTVKCLYQKQQQV